MKEVERTLFLATVCQNVNSGLECIPRGRIGETDTHPLSLGLSCFCVSEVTLGLANGNTRESQDEDASGGK